MMSEKNFCMVSRNHLCVVTAFLARRVWGRRPSAGKWMVIMKNREEIFLTNSFLGLILTFHFSLIHGLTCGLTHVILVDFLIFSSSSLKSILSKEKTRSWIRKILALVWHPKHGKQAFVLLIGSFFQKIESDNHLGPSLLPIVWW